MSTIGERVIRLRAKRGLSKVELARLVNIGAGTISHIENNRRKPSIDLAIRLAEELGTSLDELLGNTEPETEQAVVI